MNKAEKIAKLVAEGWTQSKEYPDMFYKGNKTIYFNMFGEITW